MIVFSWQLFAILYLLVGALIAGVAMKQVNEHHYGVYVLVMFFWLPLTVSSAVKAILR